LLEIEYRFDQQVSHGYISLNELLNYILRKSSSLVRVLDLSYRFQSGYPRLDCRRSADSESEKLKIVHEHPVAK